MTIKCYTVKAVADILKLSTRGIQNFISEGKLRAYKGQSNKEGYLIPEPQLFIFLNSIAYKNKEASDFLHAFLNNILPREGEK